MSTKILVNRSSALSLESMMIQLERQGEGIDSHRVCTFNHPDRTIQLRRHTFDRRESDQAVSLSHRLVSWAEPWISEIRFITDLNLPRPAQRCFYCLNKSELYTTMFYAEGADLFFGPFFSRSSEVRSVLQEYIESLYGQEMKFSETGSGLWRKIQDTHGLTGLLAIWNDLYESTILPEMLLMDPFCFD